MKKCFLQSSQGCILVLIFYTCFKPVRYCFLIRFHLYDLISKINSQSLFDSIKVNHNLFHVLQVATLTTKLSGRWYSVPCRSKTYTGKMQPFSDTAVQYTNDFYCFIKNQVYRVKLILQTSCNQHHQRGFHILHIFDQCYSQCATTPHSFHCFFLFCCDTLTS